MGNKEKINIKLVDQSNSQAISLRKYKSIGYQRDLINYSYNFIRANDKYFRSLNIEANLSFDRTDPVIILHPNGVIGAVPLISADQFKPIGSLIVEPRFGWNEYGSLLNSIGWVAAPQLLDFSLVPGSAKDIPPWVIAGPLVYRISHLLKEINRGFEATKEIRQMPRGKILWQEYVSKSVVKGNLHEFPCLFPDLNDNIKLKSIIKWALEKIKFSINKVALYDHFSVALLDAIEKILSNLIQIKSKIPNSGELEHFVRQNSFPTENFLLGIQAISWVKDDKGLAGQNESDGLSWKIQMSDLFEHWVETVIRYWSKGFGGSVKTSRKGDVRVPIYWQNTRMRSLSDLAPDVVLETNDTVYIIDAKYKGLYEELDDDKWRELSEDIRNEHRHDLHQILAYAALYNKPRIVSLLAYPLYKTTYERMINRGKLLNRATIPIENKNVEIGMIGLTMDFGETINFEKITKELDPLINPLVI